MAHWPRRSIIRGAGALALSSLAGCKSLPPVGPPPVVSPSSTWIDVHCHVFNARDIPIVGFVTDVVMEGVPVAPELLKPLIIIPVCGALMPFFWAARWYKTVS